MIRVNVLVEGQTEETFVRDVLYPYFFRNGIILTARIIRTSKTGKGGVSSYARMVEQVLDWCKRDPTAYVTTLFDVYGLPSDFPGVANWSKQVDPFRQVAGLESSFETSISQRNFIPYLQLHEFEALLFSDVSAFATAITEQDGLPEKLASILAQFPSPEHINNDPLTAPSKRIIKIFPQYGRSKPLYGPLLAEEIGLNLMRQQCVHFNAWIERLLALQLS